MPPTRRMRYLGAFAFATAGAVSGQDADRDLAFEAASVAFDENGGSVFRQLRVTDGTISITASEGTLTESKGAERTLQFVGSVEIQFARAMLSADRATFRFADGQLTEGEMIGSPLAFETAPTENRTAFHGTAGRIFYDRSKGVVTAGEGASFAYANMRVRNCNWTYSLTDGTYSAVANDEDKCVASITRANAGVTE